MHKLCVIPGDLGTRKVLALIVKKIYFSILTTKFLMKYDLICFHIFDRLTIFFAKHDC